MSAGNKFPCAACGYDGLEMRPETCAGIALVKKSLDQTRKPLRRAILETQYAIAAETAHGQRRGGAPEAQCAPLRAPIHPPRRGQGSAGRREGGPREGPAEARRALKAET